jgi:L-ascorbate metabolism protein UlaG (beta-lactamase superfamily)
MDYTHIRNATALLNYGGIRLLIDPWFAEKGTLPSFGGGERNPTVDLPLPVDETIAGADAVLVTHLHEDHFDAVAKQRLPKDMPILCTLPLMAELSLLGFTAVTPLDPGTVWRDVTITPVMAQHGPPQVLYRMGHVVGYVLRAKAEPALYLASDTILTDSVREVIRDEAPEVIVMNAGGAFSRGKDGPIIMDAAQVIEALALAPGATGIAVHLGATDHCRVTRQSLRAAAAEHSAIASRLLIPEDGETLTLA